MSVYMHGMFQAKVDGQWKTIERDYPLRTGRGVFHWLGYCPDLGDLLGFPAIVPPRGLPTDYLTASEDRFETNSAAHYLSWLTAEEILDAPIPAGLTGALNVSSTDSGFKTFLEDTQRLKDAHGEVRFLFSFDEP